MASQKSTELIDEMVKLSVDIINACQSLNLPRTVFDQLTRSATSVGANFSEAQDASSKKDFINKIFIAKKEAAETKYWLAIVMRLTGKKTELMPLSDRVHNFLMMLQKIINTSNGGNRK